MQPIDLYSYFDYHAFLADYYAAKKAEDPAFSHRAFCARAGVAGSMYLQRIMTRKRKLSFGYINHFIKALSLHGRGAKYFRLLVAYGNQKNAAKKEAILKAMLPLRSDNAHKIQNHQLRYFEKWYYPVVRELVTIGDFRDDYNRLAGAVVPRISPVQAKGAVRYLLKNGFIRKAGAGRYEQADAVVTTGPEVNSTILAGFHKKNLSLAIEAIDRIDRAERDVSSVTLSVSRDNYWRIKREIQHFRKNLLAIAQQEKKPEVVCHVGMQLLPRSRMGKEGNSHA
jgi:uncharacterized protein (TIGR02147 family)